MIALRRDGKPARRDCRRELAALCRVWCLKTAHLAVPAALPQGDRRRWRTCGRGERSAREPRCVARHSTVLVADAAGT